MRCLKCGKFNWFYPKKCKKCGAPNLGRTKKSNLALWVIIIVIIVSIGLFAFIGILTNKQFDNVLAGIQKNLIDTAIAKANGDLIMAGKKSEATMDSIQATAITAAKNLAELQVPDELKNYQASAIVWSIEIAVATEQKSNWKKLKNQPNDFPLILTDIKAENNFKISLATINDFKKAGTDAIKNKDRQTMFAIGIKTLIQNHWLNAILHSKNNSTVSNSLTISAFAASPSGLQSVPNVKGVDVTCLVCDYPDTYKVKWTDKLRQQYGCEVRCRSTKTTEDKTEIEKSDAESVDDSEYAETLANYSYNNAPKRSICIGTGGMSAGNETTRKYCVEDAVQSTNEIAASAINFATGSKELTIDQWDKEYENVDLDSNIANEAPNQAVTPTEQINTAPSKPSADNGHKESGIGTIQQGDPIATPEPAKKQSAIWDGNYSGTLNSTCITKNLFEGTYSTEKTQRQSSFSVGNNKLIWDTIAGVPYTGSGEINTSGYVRIDFEWGYYTYQFYNSQGKTSAKVNTMFGKPGDLLYCVAEGILVQW